MPKAWINGLSLGIVLLLTLKSADSQSSVFNSRMILGRFCSDMIFYLLLLGFSFLTNSQLILFSILSLATCHRKSQVLYSLAHDSSCLDSPLDPNHYLRH